MKKWKELSKGKKFLIIVVVIIVAVVAFGGKSDDKKQNNDNMTTGTTNITEAQPEQKTEEKFAFDDGKHEVGKDVQPGTYRTRGSDGSSFGCYWARLSGFSGELDEILANNGSFSGGSQVVTIEEGDKGFETRGCGKWYAELTQVTENKTSFGAGTMIVGTDIEPGTYKNSGADDEYSCYWARLSGFSGELSEILANENSQNTIVTVAATDKGFTSTGCGTWTKQ